MYLLTYGVCRGIPYILDMGLGGVLPLAEKILMFCCEMGQWRDLMHSYSAYKNFTHQTEDIHPTLVPL